MKKISLLLASLTLLAGCYSNIEEVEELNENIENVEVPSAEISAEASDAEASGEDERLKKLGEEFGYDATYTYLKMVDGEEVAYLEELPDSELIDERPFDSCGKQEEYEERPWLKELLPVLQAIDQDPKYSPLNKGLDGSLVQLCLSLDQKYVIGIYSNVYCSSGFIFRYNTESKQAEVAKFLDEISISCDATFAKFGKRDGAVIPVYAYFGDAGCKGEDSYDYDFTKNTLKKQRHCWGCWNSVDTDGDGKINAEAEPVFQEECEDF